jgi:hypothetical protein
MIPMVPQRHIISTTDPLAIPAIICRKAHFHHLLRAHPLPLARIGSALARSFISSHAKTRRYVDTTYMILQQPNLHAMRTFSPLAVVPHIGF